MFFSLNSPKLDFTVYLLNCRGCVVCLYMDITVRRVTHVLDFVFDDRATDRG